MPLVPHYPSDDPEPNDTAPDLNEIVDRILTGDPDPYADGESSAPA